MFQSWLRLLFMACLVGTMGCGKRSLVHATLAAGPPISLAMLTVEMSDGQRTWTWTAEDFSTGPDRPRPTTDDVQTASSGMLQLQFRLERGGHLLGAGEVQIPLKEDWRWQVQFQASTEDPQLQCFGCFGGRAFTLDSTLHSPGRDSLWVVWGGNSITNPVVY